jgi:WD40 repeat protein
MNRLIISLALLLVVGPTLFSQDLLKLTVKIKSPAAFSYSHDNKYLAVSTNSEVQLLNAGSDTKATTLSGARDVSNIIFSGDNSIMATASGDKTIKLWTIPEGKLKTTLTGHTDGVLALRFMNNDTFIVSIGEDKAVNLWSIDSAKIVYSKKDHIKAIRALDVSFDDKWIATGGADREIFLRDAATGNVVKKLSGHENWIRTVVFSPDSKLLASGSDDKKIILWDVATGKQIREFPQRGWIYDLQFSNDGKYLFAALEKNSVAVYDLATGLPALKLEDFQTPVKAIAVSPNGKELASIEEFVQAVKYWNIESLHLSPVFRHKDSKDKSAPLILVSNPPNIQDSRVRIYQDMIDLRGTVTDESGVRSLKVNGIVTPVKDNGNFVINMPLATGDNYISMEVTDVNDNIALKKFVITRKNADGEEYNPATAKNYLLVVGINNYRHWPKLNNAVKDASDIATVLMNKYNFDFSNVMLVRDEQATRSNIYNSLRSLIEKVSPQDNLVVYFSGHGYFDQLLNEGYWIPVDAAVNSTGDYISNTEILKILGSINSQHTFLVADACFSGALFADSRRGYTDNVEKFKSRWGLASGRLEVVSDGTIGNNSPFAKRFLQFLQQNEKEKFAVSELIQHVKTQVAEDTDQTPVGNPLKALGDEGGEMVFYKKKE